MMNSSSVAALVSRIGSSAAWLILGMLLLARPNAFAVGARAVEAERPNEAVFAAGPNHTRPFTFYFWMNGNVTKAGIDADLEAMKKVGLGGLLIFEGNTGIPQGPVDYLSPQWHELMRHLMGKAKALGLQVGIHNAPGWSSSGGPWITPERSMQQLVWTETLAAGGQPAEIKLPQPYTKLGFYRDIAVLAYPAGPGDDCVDRKLIAEASVGQTRVDHNKLTDRDLHTAVSIAPEAPLVIRMAQAYTARAITLNGAAQAKAFNAKLEASDDGVHWRPVATITTLIKHLRGIEAPGSINLPQTHARYFRITPNVAVELAEVAIYQAPRIDNWSVKSGNSIDVPPRPDSLAPALPDTRTIAADSIIDLTSQIDGRGVLRWNPPAGQWTVLRIGHTSTAHLNVSASTAGEGLEVDKLDRDAVDLHFDRGIKPLLESIHEFVGSTFSLLEIDSYEAGLQNWTASLPAEFIKQNSYDLIKLLPALTGKIVGSAKQSEQFLFDYRRTLARLMASNYYARMRARANEYGLKLYVEGYGPGPFDALQVSGEADVPMTEFWTRAPWGDERSVKMAASAAHVYGKKLVAAEAFTGRIETSRWQDYPYALKALGDQMFSQGVNHLIFHRYTHQPNPNAFPGMTMGPWGFNFDKTNTWFFQSPAWLQYLSRAQYLLRMGTPVADVLYFVGEDSPNQSEYVRPSLSDDASPRYVQYSEPAMPPGYNFDLVNAGILDKLKIENGWIVLPSGGRYRMLVLPKQLRRMTPGLLARLDQLVRQGMVLLGSKPEQAYHRTLSPAEEAAFRERADSLWGKSESELRNGRRVADGYLYSGVGIRAVLDRLKLGPDADCFTRSRSGQLAWSHRKLADRDLYFVSNQRRRHETVRCTFRVANTSPTLWNAEDGTVSRPVLYSSDGQSTQLTLSLPPASSMFVSLEPGTGQGLRWVSHNGRKISALEVSKDLKQGAPANNFTQLLWAKPDVEIAKWPDEASLGRMNEMGLNYLVDARSGIDMQGPGVAVAGLALARNGAIVIERASPGRVAPVLVSNTPVAGWTHVALVYADGAPALYLNGRLVSHRTASGMKVIPGGDDPPSPQGMSYLFEGNNTALRTLPRALSAEEIAADYAKGLPDPQLPELPLELDAKPGSLLGKAWQSGHFQTDAGHSAYTSVPAPVTINGPWLLSFQAGRGAPATLELPSLMSLSKHAIAGVRHFSGTVRYEKSFQVAGDWLKAGRQVYLDLGRLEVIAEVTVNGKPVGTAWKEPYRLDISAALRSGENQLSISVANLWSNRLIGDAQFPEEYLHADGDWTLSERRAADGSRSASFTRKITSLPDWYTSGAPKPAGGRVGFATWNLYAPDEALLESGLLGPVRILFADEVKFHALPRSKALKQ